MYMIIISLLSTASVTPSLANLRRLSLYLPVGPTLRTTNTHCAMIGVRLEMEPPSFWRMLGMWGEAGHLPATTRIYICPLHPWNTPCSCCFALCKEFPSNQLNSWWWLPNWGWNASSWNCYTSSDNCTAWPCEYIYPYVNLCHELFCGRVHIFPLNLQAAKKYFQTLGTAVHLAIDGWTSPLVTSYLGLVVIWYANGTINRAVLEFIWYILYTSLMHIYQSNIF